MLLHQKIKRKKKNRIKGNELTGWKNSNRGNNKRGRVTTRFEISATTVKINPSYLDDSGRRLSCPRTAELIDIGSKAAIESRDYGAGDSHEKWQAPAARDTVTNGTN